jgi:hypothetical protein
VAPIDHAAGHSNAPSFQDTVNEAMHHVLIDQSGVLINLIRQVVGGPPEQQEGPTYFSIDPSAHDYRVKVSKQRS